MSSRGGGAGRRNDGRDRAYAPSTPRRPPALRRPDIPPEAKPELLDRGVRKELSTLLPSTAEEVGGHLVAVGLLLDEEPERALAHAKAAKQLAARLGCTREALGLAAYRNGDFTTALAELRAARRMGGGAELLPVMADCERGLGRPERALAVGKDPAVSELDRPGKVELAIVLSGARRDLGQPDAAVLVLQGKELDDGGVHEWTPRLWYAYADALLAAGRRDEAAEWFRAVAAEDDEGLFDAEERLSAL